MKFENTRIYNFENAFRGMRNPKESYHLSDSFFASAHEKREDDGLSDVTRKWIEYFKEQYKDKKFPIEPKVYPAFVDDVENYLIHNGNFRKDITIVERNYIGPKDMKLAQQLINAGSEHRKFMRQILVSVDITAPLYWWKEFDTYKVGTVANSTSTMHKLATTPITVDSFEIGDLDEWLTLDPDLFKITYVNIIDYCEQLRLKYFETKDKRYWKELIRWLPESWLQTRTVTMDYENLLAMCGRGQRRFHKLNEWSGVDEPDLPNFISWARTLPYAQDLLFIDEEKGLNNFLS